jgi:hypothetical protein
LLIAGASFGVNHYKTKWQGEIHAEYAEQARIAINKRNADIERLKLQQAETNRKVVADYENQLKTLSDRLASAKRDGLRMPKTVCSGIADTAETASAKGADGDETVRLPGRIEIGLFGLAEKCEQVQIERNLLIDWIKENGFYP